MKAFLLVFWLAASPAAAEVLTVTLLGTGTPRPDAERFSQAILVETAEHKLLFDAGRGAVMRLHQIGVSADRIDRVFLTHLHFDHVVGLDDLWLTARLWQRRENLPVAGPEGTAEFVSRLSAAYDRDVEGRAAQSGLPAENGALHGHDLSPGVVFEEGMLRVIAVPVSHGAMNPAFGYRVNYGSRSLVISGDTTYSEEIVRAARGADVLIHEAMMASDTLLQNNPRLRRVQEYHATAEEVAHVLRETTPKLAVLVHLLHYGVSRQQLLETVQASYSGAVRLGEDGMAIDIGDTLYEYRRTGGSR